MAQDLKELFKNDRKVADRDHKLKQGHTARFLEKLAEELPSRKKSSYGWLKIAASVAVLLTASIFYFNRDPDLDTTLTDPVVDNEAIKRTTLSLGDLSPDLKKVEDYYVANINLALSELEVSQESKEMTDGFMQQLSKLNEEYRRLNTELNTQGPNDQTITALIKNLQLRLQLLQKLKTKLNELKSSKNEQVKIV